MPMYSIISSLQAVCCLYPLQGSVHMRTFTGRLWDRTCTQNKAYSTRRSHKRLFGPLIHSTSMVFMSEGPSCVTEFTTCRQMDDSKPGEGSSHCATRMLGLHKYAEVGCTMVYRSASKCFKHVCQASLACISPPYQSQAVGEVGHLHGSFMKFLGLLWGSDLVKGTVRCKIYKRINKFIISLLSFK